MMTNARVGWSLRRPADAGPPLPAVAAISTALFVAGIVVPLALAGGAAYPSPFGNAETLAAYVAGNSAALRYAALLQLAAAIPLAIYAAAVVARLHALGVRAAGPTIALVGGVLASAALAVSACAQWVLSRLTGDSGMGLLGAVRDLAFIAGGPWHVVAFGLLIAGVAVSAAYHQLLPKAVCIAGITLAVVCELATLGFASEPATYLVPIGRFGGLIWIVVAGALLPHSRAARARQTGTSSSAPATRAGQ